MSEIQKYEPHWKAFFDRRIQRHDGTPSFVIQTFEEWHDGPKTAMYRFLKGQPIDPSHLHAELSKIMGEWETEDEAKRLRETMKWGIRQDRLVGLVARLKEDFSEFYGAAGAVEMDEDLLKLIVTEISKEPANG